VEGVTFALGFVSSRMSAADGAAAPDAGPAFAGALSAPEVVVVSEAASTIPAARAGSSNTVFSHRQTATGSQPCGTNMKGMRRVFGSFGSAISYASDMADLPTDGKKG